MKREDFKKIIKIRSFYKIDRRKGDYKLPSGDKLSVYVRKLVDQQLALDKLFIRENGNLCFGTGGDVRGRVWTWGKPTEVRNDILIIPPFQDNETVTYEEHEKRIDKLVREIVG